MLGGFQSIQAGRTGTGPKPTAESLRSAPAWLRAALLLTLIAAGPAESAAPALEPLPAARPLVVTAAARLDLLDLPPRPSDARTDARRADAADSMPDARVAASPDASEPSPTAISTPTPRQSEDDDLPPLTRAATRRRVESISPLPWLARFGPVSLEQHE